jgi:hypothetical protein
VPELTVADLTDDHVGSYVELGEHRPFARGKLLGVDRSPAGTILRIEHSGHGHTFPVSAPVADDTAVIIP